MGSIILVTGGTRSGKSDYALKRAETFGGSRCFVATCPVTDEEMSARIEKHRQARDQNLWSTVEESLAIDEILKRDAYDLYLVDCLTLWISNQMVHCSSCATECSEGYIETMTRKLLETISTIKASVIFVTNEVGLGIVPGNELARRYRDLVGLCNRLVAAAADEAVLISCGLPLHLKNNYS